MIDVEEIHKLFRKKDDIMTRLNERIRKRGHPLYQRGLIKERMYTPIFRSPGVHTRELDHSKVVYTLHSTEQLAKLF